MSGKDPSGLLTPGAMVRKIQLKTLELEAAVQSHSDYYHQLSSVGQSEARKGRKYPDDGHWCT
jgi:hypothetical protein